MKLRKLLFLIVLVTILTGCNSGSNSKNIVNVLNWSSYIPDEVIDDFEKETGIRVNYGTYSSNEELLAKVNSSKEGTYDVIFPSDYMVELMIKRGLIQPLDKSRLTNTDNLNTIFLRQVYDYNNDYSYPFLTTDVVIAVNRNHIKDDIKSYNDLLNSKYKNNIVLIEDQRIIIGMALLANGYDMSSVSDIALDRARDWLFRLKPNIKAYDSDSPKSFFMTEEADIGVMWNAEAELAKIKNPNIEIIDPVEGHAISTDNYCIVKGAKNIDNAYMFINYLLRNEVSDKITKEYPYISPNNIKQNSIISPYKIFNKGYYVKNIGSDIKKYDNLWALIK